MTFTDRERIDLSKGLYRALLDLGNNQPISDAKIRALSCDLAFAQEKLAGDPGPKAKQQRELFFPLATLAGAMQERSLTPNTFSAGGAFIGEDVGSPEPLLRAASVVGKAGARVLSGLRGNLTIPKQTADSTYSFYHDLDTIVESDSTFAGLTLSAKRLGGATSISSALDLQTGSILSTFLAESLSLGIATGIDRGALQGTGTAGEVMGLWSGNSANIGSVTFSGSPTLAKAVSFVSQVATANAPDENIVFVSHPQVREYWATRQRFTGGAALWTDDNKVVGKPAFVTTNAPATGICCGDFTKMILGFFGEGTPVRIIVDPYSQSLQHRVRMVVQVWCDVVIQSQAFCRNADSATQ